MLDNFTEDQLEVIQAVAIEMAAYKSSRFSGEVVFKVPYNQGGISGSLKINTGKMVKIGRQRRIRSPGIK